MLRRGQVTVVAVGDADDDGARERAAPLQIEADLNESLERNRTDGYVANADGLQRNLQRLAGLGQSEGSACIGFCQRRQLGALLLVLEGDDLFRSLGLLGSRLSQPQRDLALHRGKSNVRLVGGDLV